MGKNPFKFQKKNLEIHWVRPTYIYPYQSLKPSLATNNSEEKGKKNPLSLMFCIGRSLDILSPSPYCYSYSHRHHQSPVIASIVSQPSLVQPSLPLPSPFISLQFSPFLSLSFSLPLALLLSLSPSSRLQMATTAIGPPRSPQADRRAPVGRQTYIFLPLFRGQNKHCYTSHSPRWPAITPPCPSMTFFPLLVSQETQTVTLNI